MESEINVSCLYSNISNNPKAEDQKLISHRYHLGMKIEEGKME